MCSAGWLEGTGKRRDAAVNPCHLSNSGSEEENVPTSRKAWCYPMCLSSHKHAALLPCSLWTPPRSSLLRHGNRCSWEGKSSDFIRAPRLSLHQTEQSLFSLSQHFSLWFFFKLASSNVQSTLLIWKLWALFLQARSLEADPQEHQQKSSECSKYCQCLLKNKTACQPPPARFPSIALVGQRSPKDPIVLWKERSNSSQFRCLGDYWDGLFL